MEFAVRQNKTRLVKSYASPPLQVQRALYLDEAAPDLAFLYLQNSTAGLFQDDLHTINVTAGPQTRAHLTTPAATKVFAMPHGEARQSFDLDLREGAYLEYLPEPVIPFRGARLSQYHHARLSAGAVLVTGEILLPGRVARGEIFAFRRLERRLTVSGPGGKPVLHESSLLTPQETSPLGISAMNRRFPVTGSLSIIAPGHDTAKLRDALERLLAGYPAGCLESKPGYDARSEAGHNIRDGEEGQLLTAITTLPRQGGLAVRTLTADAETAGKLLRRVLESARRHFLAQLSQ